MSNVITRTSDSATTTPVLVVGYRTERQSRNVVHNLIGGDIAVTLVDPRPRSGELVLLYDNETDAWAGYNLHGAAAVFTLASDEVASVDMAYVIDGTVAIALDDQSQAVWLVTVGYQEVSL